MVRVLGVLEEPEAEQERADLEERATAHWEQYHRAGAEPFRDELVARVALADATTARFLQMEAIVIERPGVAAEIYPELFALESDLVDRDGLVDYRDLLRRMTQVQPGVFHDPSRDLLVFAHRFFRRSLSHRNKLNTYFLQTFGATASASRQLRVRLKLDPDLLGHPSSAQNRIELEYWRGPLYRDDIIAIPNGVAEYKADDRSRQYEGIDRTQMWWKAPEQRHVDAQPMDYRTFEVEELIEDPSSGLSENRFGCRYAHAEFSVDEAAITHFDGAIRAYSGETYLERIEKSIDRAGKHSDYTKLFRIDGALVIREWKQLLSDFFRGNALIPEYLGARAKMDEAVEEDVSVVASAATAPPAPALAALISLEPSSTNGAMQLCSDLCLEYAGQLVSYVEVGIGAVETYLRSRMDFSHMTTVGFRDDVLNMSRLVLGASSRKDGFDKETRGLASALRLDVANSIVRRAAIPLVWEVDGLVVTLTIAGEADKVASALQKIHSVVDPEKVPSEWIEALSDMVRTIAPSAGSSVMWSGVDRGVLAIDRSDVEVQMRVPEALQRQLLATDK